jgi:hypothetical protein
VSRLEHLFSTLPQSPFRQKTSFYWLLIVLGGVAYGNAIFHPFVHDDVVFIQANPQISQFNIKSIFLSVGNFHQETSLANSYYRPLLEILYRLEYLLFHFHAWGYHLFNIGLHVLNSFLIVQVFQLVLQRHNALAMITALFFLIHPVQTEAVACIAGISNLAFTFFLLLSFWLYLPAPGSGKDKSLGTQALSLACFVLAVLAKEQAIIFPLLLLFYEISWPAEARGGLIKYRRVLIYFIVGAGYFAWRKIILGNALGPLFDDSGELWLRIQLIPQTILGDVRLLVAPHDLHYYRSADILAPSGTAMAILAALAGAMIVVLRRMDQESRRLILWGLGWFFITLLPVLNIVPLVNEYSLILTAEHFLYLPMAGAVLVLAVLSQWALLRVSPAHRGQLTTVILGVVMGVCLLLTIKQNTYWRNEIALFRRTLQFERLGRVHILLANAYYREGRLIESLEENQKALKIFEGYVEKIKNNQALPFYLGFIKGIHFEMAHIFDALGDLPSAVDHFQKALELDPQDAALHNNLAVVLLKGNRLNEARQHFEEAVALEPPNGAAKKNLALIYFDTGDLSRAEVLAKELVHEPEFSFFAEHLLLRIGDRLLKR